MIIWILCAWFGLGLVTAIILIISGLFISRLYNMSVERAIWAQAALAFFLGPIFPIAFMFKLLLKRIK